jgi:hypothetical protein
MSKLFSERGGKERERKTRKEGSTKKSGKKEQIPSNERERERKENGWMNGCIYSNLKKPITCILTHEGTFNRSLPTGSGDPFM